MSLGESMNKKMYDSSRLGNSMSTNVCVSMHRNLSISILNVKLSLSETMS